MCGICGIVDFSGNRQPSWRSETVDQMNNALLHRGPDGSGKLNDDYVSLAMRRLAIIDTDGGDQPIYNEDKSVLTFYNGEIYNYRSLRKKLERKGHTFSTKSDTEVIVHLYEQYGEKFPIYLKGMFAICLYDITKKKILIFRDRFGEKPLFFYHKEHVLSFSSEVNSLLENSQINRKLNRESLPYYLRTATIPEPYTLLADIYSLAPGHYLKMTNKGLRTITYFRPDKESSRMLTSEEEAIEFIKPRLRKAVKRQMVSDVPIGAFLSGGIDSSSIVALMQEQSVKPIKTFNVRFENEAFDESAIAEKVAMHCGTDHHQIVVPNATFDESMFWEIIEHIGFPFRDTSAIPMYLISREISKHVKVALSGDGGDEIFGGYDIFQWYLTILKSKKAPKSLRILGNSLASVAQSTPGLKEYSQIRKIKRGLQTSLSHQAVLPVLLSEMFNKVDIAELLQEENDFALYSPFTNSPQSSSDLRNIMYYRLMHVLPVNMLTKVDRMSMAHSLEVRAPFLDIDLFDASLEIPDDLLIKKKKGKYLLRQMMKENLPKEVFDHKKTGFNLPLHSYINRDFEHLAQDLLFNNNPWPGFFDPILLKQIFESGINQKQDSAKQSTFQASHQLWMIMQLLGWARRFKISAA